MPRVAILVDLTKAQLDTLIANGYMAEETTAAKATKKNRIADEEAIEVQYRETRSSAPKIKNPEQYRREPGTPPASRAGPTSSTPRASSWSGTSTATATAPSRSPRASRG